MDATKEVSSLGVFATLKATPMPARYLLGGVLINQMGAFIQAFLVLYLVYRGLTIGQAGVSLGVYGFGAVLGAMVGGELTHRLGSRNTIAVSMAASAVILISIPSLARPDRYGLLLVGVAMAGAITQAYRPAVATMLSDLMPAEHRVMTFSMLRIALNLGAAIGPLIAAGLILVNWDLLFWVDGSTALIYAGLALVLLPRDSATKPDATATTESPIARRSAYGVLVRDTRFLCYLAAMLLSAAIYVQFFAVLPLKIVADGHSTTFYSIVLATSSVILITCELKVTTYTRRWLASVAGGIGNALLAVGLAGYGISSGSAALIVIFTVFFVSGLMVSGPTMFAHPAKAPAAVKGRYLGASQAMFGLGLAVGPALGALAWSHVGNGIWLICGIIGFAATAFAVIGMQEQPQPVAAEATPVR